MANGIVVQSQAVWKGVLELKGIHMEGEFEAFDSSGGWKFLFGKPLLWRFQAIHNYNLDTVSIRSEHSTATLHNNAMQVALTTPTGNHLTPDVEQQEHLVGGSSGMKPPSRQVLHMGLIESVVRNDESGFTSDYIEDKAEEADKCVKVANTAGTGLFIQ